MARPSLEYVTARVAGAINRWNPDPDKGSFRGWISQITRNLVIQFLRSKSRRPLTSDDTSIERMIAEAPEASPESEWFDLEHERQVFAWAAEKIRTSFQPRSWQAFWLTAVENKPADEVAQQLGISKGSVYIARSRVMARLREKVQFHTQMQDADSNAMSITRPFLERNER